MKEPCMKKKLTPALDELVQALQDEIRNISQDEAQQRIWNESEELQQLFEKHHPLIVVAANIGFGKTTAARYISTYGRALKLEEPVDDNFLLSAYYDDMKNFSFGLQIQVINERLYSLVMQRRSNPKEALVSDRSVYEDTITFSEALTRQELMEDWQLKFLRKYLHQRTLELQHRYKVDLTPDVVLFLHGSLETGWKRAGERGRSIEFRKDARRGVGLTKEFYGALHEQYQQFHQSLQEYYQGPVLTLPQDTVDVSDVRNSKGQYYVIRSMREAVKMIFETAKKPGEPA